MRNPPSIRHGRTAHRARTAGAAEPPRSTLIAARQGRGCRDPRVAVRVQGAQHDLHTPRAQPVGRHARVQEHRTRLGVQPQGRVGTHSVRRRGHGRARTRVATPWVAVGPHAILYMAHACESSTCSGARHDIRAPVCDPQGRRLSVMLVGADIRKLVGPPRARVGVPHTPWSRNPRVAVGARLG